MCFPIISLRHLEESANACWILMAKVSELAYRDEQKLLHTLNGVTLYYVKYFWSDSIMT